MSRPRSGQSKGGGQQSHYDGFNRNQNGRSAESGGVHQWNNSNGSNRARRFRSKNRGGYDNRRGGRNNFNRKYDCNEFRRENEEDESQDMGFKKFRDSNLDSNYHNNSKMWYDDNIGDFSNGAKPSPTRSWKSFPAERPLPVTTPLAQSPVVNSKTSIEKEQPKLKIKIKRERPSPPKDSETLTKESLPASEEVKKLPEKKKKKRSEKTSVTDSPPQSSKEKTPIASVKEVPAALSKPTDMPSTSTSTSASDNSSSSDEEVVPDMPRPVRVKKERSSQADVVCLGNKTNIQNLTDDDDSDDPQTCIVCNKTDHSSVACQVECKKCSHTAYEMQMVCKNCGETYREGLPSMSKTPNFFSMFMNFMQFCAIQNDNVGAFTQLSNPPITAQGSTQKVETSRKDSANSTKQNKKKRRNSSKKNETDDSEDDSSAKTSNSKAKRKKTDKSTNLNAPLQHHLPSFHTNMQFPAHFHAPGFNPMFGFNPLMGFNPATMNFTK